MKQIGSFFALAIATTAATFLPFDASAQETRLLRMPDVSIDHVAFVYANDIWIANRDGSDVRRLTTFEGAETYPHFSPDGRWVAFSGQYDGNTDVYVVPVEGGEPKRLTWHPYSDIVKGWTVDGKSILFASGRDMVPVPIPKFWTIATDGANPDPLPLPRAQNGHYSPDGTKFVYEMVTPWETEFRNYRGGQNNPIRIIDLRTLDVEKLPWDGTMDQHPNWIGDTIFFMSDRDYTMNVWSYNTTTGALEQRTHFEEFDVKNLEAGAGSLIFENGGYLYTMEASGGEPQELSISVRGDFPWARPHWESVSSMIRAMDISPNAKRAVFEARGEIFTVPAEHGDIRNLTESSGAADRDPAWSPDGQSVAWFSDASGEYRLVVADQYGQNSKSFDIEDPTFFYRLDWAPDSRHLAFTDMDQNLRIFDVQTGKGYIVDNANYSVNQMTFAWSPDSKWLAYAKMLDNQYHAIYVHQLDDRSNHAITDGMSQSTRPAWDAGGKYLYFLSSVDYALNVGWLDMTSYYRPQNSAVNLVVLASDETDPLAPRSDDEGAEDEEDEVEGAKGKDKKNVEKDDKADDEEDSDSVDVRIDFDGITSRILALDVPTRSYRDLIPGEKGVLFIAESIPNESGVTLHRYKLEDRKSEEFMSEVAGVVATENGKKLLVRKSGNTYAIVDATGSVNPTEGDLDLSEMKMYLDPPDEWRQIWDEAIRFQRDLLYVENAHGLDLDWVRSTYGPWLDHIRHRSDLTYLLDILGGEVSIGHSFAGGGDLPDVETVTVGLLGADIAVENGAYRIRKIYQKDPWTSGEKAPLSGPGIDVSVGDYVLAVNGKPVSTAQNFFNHFEQTNGKETVLTVASDPNSTETRRVKVYPIPSDLALRQYDWVESNRRRVDELSDGRLAYVWLPNTGGGGYRNFNRYYFAQKDKKGAVIDERFNGGGSIADYIVDYMDRDLLGYFNNNVAEHKPFTVPDAALFGPKVMIVNERAGSGGDMLPYLFREKKIGPLIGTKTWGGLVGWGNQPPFVDGGFISAPWVGFYSVNGEWDVENIGVAPDIEVEEDPKAASEGRDAQLERAVEVALDLLKTQEVEILPQPPDPVRVRRAGQ